MELDLSCFDKDFDRLNLLVQEQSKHLRKKEKLYESQVYTFLEENREDLLDYALLEQVRRDQWNRQYGFLLSQLGYESVPIKNQQDMLNESFWGDLAIDMIIGLAPTAVRAIGGVAGTVSFGAGVVAVEPIAKMLAGGGFIYYAHYALQERHAGEKLNMWMNVLNALFSLEQAAIPLVSDVLAGAGKLFLKFLGGFFKTIIWPFKQIGKLFSGAGKAAMNVVESRFGKIGVEWLSNLKGKEGIITQGTEALSYVMGKSMDIFNDAAKLLNGVLDNPKFMETVGPDVIVSIKSMIDDFGKAVAESKAFAESLAKGMNSFSDAIKAGKEVAKRNKAFAEGIAHLAPHTGPGGILSAVPKLETAALQAMEREFAEETAEALGRAGAEVIEREVMIGIEKVAGKSIGGAATELSAQLAKTMSGPPLYLGANVIPSISSDGGKIVFEFTTDMISAGAPAGKLAMDEGLSAYLKLLEHAFPGQSTEIYNKLLAEIAEGPIFKEVQEALGKAIQEVVEAEAGASTGKVYSWAMENLKNVFLQDFDGFLKTIDAFKSSYRLGSAGSTAARGFEQGARAAWNTATARVTKSWWGALVNTFKGVAVGTTTAGRKGTDPRTSAQKARARAAKAPKVPSTIKTRKAGTAGTPASKIKSSSAGATKTKTTVSIDDML